MSVHLDAPPLAHGGDLAAARLEFPDAPEPWIDLSTGINPASYPLPQLPSAVFARLPDGAALARLIAVAAGAYRAPSPPHILAAPGMQILLPLVAALIAPGRARVLGPTYAEHVRAATLAGHDAGEVIALAELADADLVIVVNPNNPDGRLVGSEELLGVADAQRRRGGLLVVDEAFMDINPDDASLGQHVGRGRIVVLRSFGKFYGLAGLRLGFALAVPELIARIDAMLGPWAVSGPAIAIGEAALADRAWAAAMRTSLMESARRLDGVLAAARLEVVGGTSLFRLVRTPAAYEWFCHLGRAGILVRRFAERPAWLRFGLPHGENAWRRLQAALATFR
jgi:cobalamin biosynthesis protein CobC